MIKVIAGQNKTYRVKGLLAGVEVPIPDGTQYTYSVSNSQGDIGTVAADPSVPNQLIESSPVAGSMGIIGVSVVFPSGDALATTSDEISVLAIEPDTIVLEEVV
jgi:hypothetical protein